MFNDQTYEFNDGRNKLVVEDHGANGRQVVIYAETTASGWRECMRLWGREPEELLSTLKRALATRKH